MSRLQSIWTAEYPPEWDLPVDEEQPEREECSKCGEALRDGECPECDDQRDEAERAADSLLAGQDDDGHASPRALAGVVFLLVTATGIWLLDTVMLCVGIAGLACVLTTTEPTRGRGWWS
jgi:hypothetical protein